MEPVRIAEPLEEALRSAGLDPADVAWLIGRALTEDLDSGSDITAEGTIPAEHRSVVDLVVRGSGVLAGSVVAAAVFDAVSRGACEVELPVADGEDISHGDVVLTVEGPTRAIVTAERTALNILGHLSGVASLTRQWVVEVRGTGVRVRDTRKTMPGLRALEKYAVRCGGGVNHRMGLFDAGLIKDNHAAAAGGVAQAYLAMKRRFPDTAVQVEVDSLEQLAAVLEVGATSVLLDNFTLDDLMEAVRLSGGRAELEASGGLSLFSARRVAETGVSYIAVGALTHSAPVLDIGADYRREA